MKTIFDVVREDIAAVRGKPYSTYIFGPESVSEVVTQIANAIETLNDEVERQRSDIRGLQDLAHPR